MRSTAVKLATALAAFLAALPAAASADGTVGAMLDEDTYVGARLLYVGDDGRNALRLGTRYDSAGRRWVMLRDAAGRIEAGPRCVQVEPQAVRCTSFAMEPSLLVRAEGGDDLVRFRWSTWGWGKVDLYGGDGDDRLDARRWLDDPSPGGLWMHGEAGDDVMLSPKRPAEDEEPVVIGGSGDDVSCGRGWEWDFDGRRSHDRVYGPRKRCPR